VNDSKVIGSGEPMAMEGQLTGKPSGDGMAK
jgi:hypothetical protein